MADRRTGWIMLALVMATVAAQAATDDVALTIWRDPEFQKQFLGTYGVRAEIEPRITAAEQLSSVPRFFCAGQRARPRHIATNAANTGIR